jgi:hypothetical protein
MFATEAAIANHRLCLRKLLVGWKAATRDFQVPEERKATGQMPKTLSWQRWPSRYGDGGAKTADCSPASPGGR